MTLGKLMLLVMFVELAIGTYITTCVVPPSRVIAGIIFTVGGIMFSELTLIFGIAFFNRGKGGGSGYNTMPSQIDGDFYSRQMYRDMSRMRQLAEEQRIREFTKNGF